MQAWYDLFFFLSFIYNLGDVMDRAVIEKLQINVMHIGRVLKNGLKLWYTQQHNAFNVAETTT